MHRMRLRGTKKNEIRAPFEGLFMSCYSFGLAGYRNIRLDLRSLGIFHDRRNWKLYPEIKTESSHEIFLFL